MRHLRFVLLLIKLKLTHMMMYRANFFGVFFADGILFVMQLIAFQVIYGNVDSIGGWSRGQMLIFIGTFSMINGLNMMVYFFGVSGIPSKIREGMLDHYITKPMNILLRLTFEDVNPGSFPLIFLSGAIILYGVNTAEVAVTLPTLLLYILFVLLMTLLWYDMEVILRTMSFFFIAVNANDPIERIEGNLIMLNFKVPGVVYKGVFKVLFYFIFPYGIMATLPTQLLTGVLTSWEFIYAVGVVALFTAFTFWFWKFGLRHYKSASS